MPSMRWLRRSGALLFLLFPMISCGSDDRTPADEGERTIQAALADAVLYPGEVALVMAGEAVFTAESYDGSVAGLGVVPLARIDSVTLAFTIPLGTSAGAYDVEIRVPGQWRMSFHAQVQTAPSTGDGEAVISTALTEVDSMIAEVEAMIADTSMSDPGGLALVSALSAELHAWRDTASAQSRAAVAQVLAANGLLAGAASAPSAAAGWSIEECDTGTEDPTATFVLCQAAATLSVGRATTAVVVAGALCLVEPTRGACLVAGGIALTAIVRANGWVVRLTEQPGIVLDHVFADFTGDDMGGAARLVAPTSFQDTLFFVSGVGYSMSAMAPYRSIVAADSSLHSELAGAVSAVNTLHRLWTQAADVVDAVEDFVSGMLPALPTSAGPAPSSPRTTLEAAIPTARLRIENVSAGVSVSFDPQSGTFSVTTTQDGAVPFHFDVVFDYLFGTVRTTFTGVVTPSSVMSIVSGDGQEAKPGEALTEPLVVRVTSLIDGAGIPGAAVTWSVTQGGGAVTGDATTDSAGYASAHWTLGDTEGSQAVQAAATLADGSAVSGSPVVFGSNASLTLQLVMVLGDNQTGEPNTPLSQPLIARVVDQDLMPIEGRLIEWAVTSGDGTLSSTQTVTDANGEGQVVWTLGNDSTGTVQASLFLEGGQHAHGSPITFNASVSGQPGPYTLTIIPTFGGDAYSNYSIGRGINNHGEVVGWSVKADGNQHAFVWSGGTLQELPSTRASWAYAINDDGLIAGGHQDLDCSLPVLWRSRTLETLPVPTNIDCASHSVASNLTAAGAAVGRISEQPQDAASHGPVAGVRWSADGARTELARSDARAVNVADGTDTGFSVGFIDSEAALWSDTGLTILPGLGSQGRAHGVNDFGTVVGWVQRPEDSCREPALWIDGQLTRLPAPATCSGWLAAEEIAENGDVVGGDGASAMIWRGGQVYDLNALVVDLGGAWLNHAYDINDSGQITGTLRVDGVMQGFVLTPVP